MAINNQTSGTSNLQLQRTIAIASAILLIAKFWAYYLTFSVSIVTDALESIVNVIAGFIGLYSLYVAAKPRDMDHPYGHGKAEFISAAVEGTLVLCAGILVIYTAVDNFFYPTPIHQLDVGIYLVAGTAVVNWLLGYFSLQQGKKNNSLALIASGRHLQTDTYTTIAIITGLVLISATGFLWIDILVAVIFGFYIVYTGYKIIRVSLAGIMDEADMELLQKMLDTLEQARGHNWVDLHNLRVIKYGSLLHIDCHLTVPWYFNVNEAHLEIDNLGQLIKSKFGEALELFVHSDACRYFQCSICMKEDCPVRMHAFINTIDWNLDTALQDKKHSQKNWQESSTEK